MSQTSTTPFEVNDALDHVLSLRDDRLQFYSDPPHRIFPRSPQLIGRLVQNCHPPKSVATVETILTSFKEGSEDSAEFYLTIGEKFIHIEYYAVRNVKGSYLGTLAVTQDATHLRELVGQKRLLQEPGGGNVVLKQGRQRIEFQFQDSHLPNGIFRAV